MLSRLRIMLSPRPEFAWTTSALRRFRNRN